MLSRFWRLNSLQPAKDQSVIKCITLLPGNARHDLIGARCRSRQSAVSGWRVISISNGTGRLMPSRHSAVELPPSFLPQMTGTSPIKYYPSPSLGEVVKPVGVGNSFP